MSHPPEYYQDPDLRGLVVYGPDANCTLATCDPRYGVYQYRPSVVTNVIFLVFFEYARFSPKLYYWVFIPCDIFSLVLQSVGGALSSQSSGNSGAAVDVSIAGLSFQVVVLVVFIGLAVDYAIRYLKGRKRDAEKRVLSTTFKVFIAFLSLAIALILVRCSYRIDELREGYSGSLIHNEPLFVGLEGV
ncbi:hypothetical protein MMC21_006044 [Puttea exsequens]|nr:hypothetical protein [Puttea exsequens]